MFATLSSLVAVTLGLSSLTKRARLTRRLAQELEMLEKAPNEVIQTRVLAMVQESSDRLEAYLRSSPWLKQAGVFALVSLVVGVAASVVADFTQADTAVSVMAMVLVACMSWTGVALVLGVGHSIQRWRRRRKSAAMGEMFRRGESQPEAPAPGPSGVHDLDSPRHATGRPPTRW